MKTEYGEVEYDDAGRAIWAGGELLGPAHQVAGGTWLICDREQLQLLLETLMEQRERCAGLDTEYDGVDRGGDDDKSPIGKAHIVCTQFGIIDDELGKHPTLPHVTLARRVFLPNFGRAETEGWLRELRPWFESPDHWKVGSFVFSTEYHVFRNHGINLYGIRGCGVRQSQTWRMGKTYTHGLKPLGTEIFGYEMREFDEVFSTPKLKKDGTPYANNQRLSIPLQEAFTDPLSALYNSGLDYASLDAKVSVEGDQHMRHELDKMPWRDGQSMLTHYDGEWNPYQYVIAGMEDAGWPVDVSWFREQHTQAVKDQAEVAERLRQWAKCDVKWSSNPQKVHFLYGAGEAEIAGNRLIGKGFPISPICKSGPTEHWDGTQTKSTDKVALEWIRDHVKRKEDKAGVADLLYWTKIDKLRSSFLETIPTWVNKWGMVNSRIGPNAETNRLTVRQPALQTLSRPGWDPVKREGDPYSIREGLSAQPDVFNRDVSRYMHEWMWIAEWDEAQQRFVKRTITGVNPEEWFGDNLALLSHDYSQLEMRILAHYLVVLFNDYSLAHDLAAGDLHAATALRVWGSDPLLKGLTPKEVKDSKVAAVKMFRNRGKIVNFCVSEDTTALTRAGWKRHDEIHVGDEVLGRSGWTTVRAVHRYENTELVDVWGFHVTRNHRWWAERRTTVGGGKRVWVPEFVETAKMTADHRARLSVPQAWEDESGLTPDEAAIIGWIVTDGHIDPHGYCSIFQKQEGKFADVIDALLVGVPHGRYVRPTGIVQWRLNASPWSKTLSTIAQNVDETWVLSLGPAQRRAFVDAGIQADGSLRKRVREDGTQQRTFAQNAGPVADAFRLAFHLEGYRVSQSESVSYTGHRFIQMALGDPYRTRQRKALETVGRAVSWCLTTDDGTFTIRRGDRIALTGNSVNYGKTAVGLGVDIRDEDGEPIGPKAAEEILRQYFSAYPAILRYHQWAKNYVRQNGYVRTLDGRYRYLPKIYSPHKGARGEAERAALNTPIQGSAAGIIMKAMLKCNTLPVPDLRRLGYFNEVLYDCGVRLVMQIHDELVHRCPRRHAKEAAAEIQRVMEHPFDDEHRGFVKSGLPLPVEFAIGTNYNEVK